MERTIFAFNGDLESRLALHWLVHERGHRVIALSINLGQGVYLEPLGELALELGASAARVIDCRESFLQDFAIPVLQSGAVYQAGCFLGSALGRYVIAQELVRVAREENSGQVAHGAANRGNDQVRMEMSIAAQAPDLKVIAPVRQWNLRTREDMLNYARRRRLPVEEDVGRPLAIDRNLWGSSIELEEQTDTWAEPPAEVFTLTRAAEDAAEEPAFLSVAFERGVPRSINGRELDLLPLVRELNRIGGDHAIGRSDVIEDQLFGTKQRQIYEAPTPTILRTALLDLESLVQSRELLQMKTMIGQRYAELVYTGYWFHDLRRSLQGFIEESQRFVTGEVRLKLYRGGCRVVGRQSPHSLCYADSAGRARLERLDTFWDREVTSLWTLPARLAARRQQP